MIIYVQYVTIVLKEGCHKASWNFGNSCHWADRWKLQVADVSAFVVPNEAFVRPITLNLLELDAVSCSLHLLKASTCIHQQNDTAMFSLAKVQVHIQCEYPTYSSQVSQGVQPCLSPTSRSDDSDVCVHHVRRCHPRRWQPEDEKQKMENAGRLVAHDILTEAWSGMVSLVAFLVFSSWGAHSSGLSKLAWSFTVSQQPVRCAQAVKAWPEVKFV